jgi:hypothetical protein
MRVESVKRMERSNDFEETQVFVRFWFFPDKSEVYATPTGSFIRNSPVKLLTEEQFWNESGQIVGKGRPHPLAQAFVEAFTRRYQDIARVEPNFAKLQFLFRLMLLRDALFFKGQLQCSNLDFFLHSCPVSPVEVPDSLPAIHTLMQYYNREENKEYYYTAPMTGGVDIRHKISDSVFIADAGGISGKIIHSALSARGPAKNPFWTFQLPPDVLMKLSSFFPG